MPSARTIASVIRTAVYATVAGVFTLSRAEAMELVDAALIGAVLADYVTWFTWTLVRLPREFWHGCYDAFINLAFGWFLFHMTYEGVDMHSDCMIVAPIVFLLVAAVKLTYYGAKLVLEDD